MRVRDSAIHTFDYEHLNLDPGLPSIGSQIGIGTLLGTVQASQTLHLQEAVSGYRLNPQRVNALDFDHSGAPQFTQASIAGASDQSIILLPEYSGIYPDGLQPSPTAFRTRDNRYFVRDKVEVLVSGRGGQDRKGLYAVGYIPSPLAKRRYDYNIEFMRLPDGPTNTNDYWTVFLSSNPQGITHFASNMKLNGLPVGSINSSWDTTAYADGPASITGFLKDFPQGHSVQDQWVSVIIDNAPPGIAIKDTAGNTINSATSSNTVQVHGAEVPGSGLYSIKLVQTSGGSYSSTTYVAGLQETAYYTFPDAGVLSDGSYTAQVEDLAGNVAFEVFIVDTAPPSTATVRDGTGSPFPGNIIINDRCAQFRASDTGSGICSMWLTGPSGYSSSTRTFPIGTADAVLAGGLCNLASGDYVLHAIDCAGNVAEFDFDASTTAWRMILTVENTPCGSLYKESAIGETELRTSPLNFLVDSDACIVPTTDVGPELCPQCLYTKIDGTPIDCFDRDACGGMPAKSNARARTVPSIAPIASTFDFSIANSSTTSLNSKLTIWAKFGDIGGGGTGISTNCPKGPLAGQTITGSLSFPQISASTYTVSYGTISVEAPISNVSISTTALTDGAIAAMRQGVKRMSSPSAYEITVDGAHLALHASTITITLHYQDVNADTDTLRICRLTGGKWDCDSITNQTVQKDANGWVTLVGRSTYTSTFGGFFDGVDTSSPTTTLATTGSSYTWGGTLFISTDSYVVLTATDALQDGYASDVSTIYYRSSAADDFSVYADSVALPVGTYFFQYRTSDWAGNLESIKTSTFVVTNRTVTQLSGGLRVSGDMLVGYSTSGAKFEVEAGGYSDYILRVSSPNNATMAAMDFIGNMGLGAESGDARLSISSNAAQGDIALQLRSGNSTGSVTSSQITMGYNGQASMRDVIRTQHHSSTAGNRMDFLVWEPSVGSTATLASLDAMSLEASTMASRALAHIHPTSTRSQDVELIVSNGVSEGGGVVRCKETVGTSAKGSKDSIRYLTTKDEDRALADIASLQPVRFRYKKQGPKGELLPDLNQPLRRGYIYEDAPSSIKVAGGALSIDERIANAEMALKASMRKLEKLQKRLAELQARKKK